MSMASASELATVGLVGLGATVRDVAANLANKGFRVFGCDARE